VKKTVDSLSSEGSHREVQWRTIDELLLDDENPRLPDDYEGASQAKLLKLLVEDYSLLDIGASIAENGYFSEEPLVTVRHPTRRKWIVIEGNRRLAALSLLAHPEHAPNDSRSKWKEIARLPKARPDRVPTLVYDTRKEITPYLGFRHITGVLPWRPYQKGRYVAQLIEKLNLRFDEIGRLIGIRSQTVREHYVTYTVVRQARESFGLQTNNIEESIGVLRRALSDPNIRDFIGLDLGRTEKELARPLKKTSSTKLRELFDWMVGTDEKAAALTDSRSLTLFGRVLANKDALKALRSTNDLTYAGNLVGGEEARLLDLLRKATFNLDQALPLVHRYHLSRDVVVAAERCAQIAKAIARIVETGH